jgi:toxin ParE1/3/4
MPDLSYRVSLTLGAQNDVRDIYAYATDTISSAYANQVVDTLIEKVKTLQIFPERGNIPQELVAFGQNEYRQLVSAPYRMLYRIVDEAVFISAVVDGRRNIPALLLRRLVTR